jgi:hypothetical protein
MIRLAAFSLLTCGLLVGGCESPQPVAGVSPQVTADRQAASSAPSALSYACRFTAQPPVIDGRLDDPAWQRAEPISLRLTENGAVPRQPTTVRALWDEKYLYLAYGCADDNIWAGFDKHDEHIFDQEVVEIFIDENCDGRSYAEIEVSPNNTTLDVYILNPGPDASGKRKFKILYDYEIEGLKTAVHVDGTVSKAPAKGSKGDRQWTVEMAVPFDQLILAPNHPPRPGDRMRWNLLRIDRHGEEPERDEFSAWSPTGQGTFHKPDRFGWLVFGW